MTLITFDPYIEPANGLSIAAKFGMARVLPNPEKIAINFDALVAVYPWKTGSRLITNENNGTSDPPTTHVSMKYDEVRTLITKIFVRNPFEDLTAVRSSEPGDARAYVNVRDAARIVDESSGAKLYYSNMPAAIAVAERLSDITQKAPGHFLLASAALG